MVTDLSTSALAERVRANEYSFVRYMGRSPRFELYDTPHLIRVSADTPYTSLIVNSVHQAYLDDNADSIIAQTRDHFAARQLPFSWFTSPANRPHDLGSRLEAHGMTRRGEAPGMAADLTALPDSPPAPAGVIVRDVDDDAALRAWAQVYAEVHHKPLDFALFFVGAAADAGIGNGTPLRLYVAWHDGEPCACAIRYMSDSVVGIYNVATLPSKRGQGIGTLITDQPMRDARDEGCTIAGLHSMPIAINIYRRLGFTEVCRGAFYAYP